MQKFYRKIIQYPKLIVSVFLIISIVCAILKPLVSVNYDMNDYLPEDSKSTISLDIMNKEFNGGIPNARVMLKNVTIPQALDYKEKISKVEGVSDVTWLDDTIEITQPLETYSSKVVESYYKDNNALMSITIDEDYTLSAVSEIRNIIGSDNAMEGSAVSTAVATESTVDEISRIVVIAVMFVILVLVLTTTSWFEPVVVLVGLGIAILINNGSNIIFGEISFVSNSAGSILQLAVSLDYSVFLLHRFTECRKNFDNIQDAMIDALCKSTSSILSSGLTTVIGFIALCIMKFKIGVDLGLVLSKGIAISLICVFVFTPCFILLTYKLIDKFQHKSLLPKFDKFSNAVTKMMVPLTIVFVMIIVPSYLASNKNGYYYGSSHIFNESTQLGKDTQLITQTFGKSDTYVLLLPKDDLTTQSEISSDLKELPQVTDIISYVDTVGQEIPSQYLDEKTYSKLVSKNYSRMVIQLDVDYEGSETFSLIEDINSIVQEYYKDNEYYLAGNGVSTYDLMNTVTSDMVKVNLIAIASVFIVLLITMKSITLPIILVTSIETAIWINLSFPYFMDNNIFYIAYLIISSIQLGATVDYAILLTDRYLEFRKTTDKLSAIKKTISSVVVSILTSGSILTVVGFLLGYISTHGLLAQLGIFLGRGTVCSLIIVLFVLPALLYLLDKPIEVTTKSSNFFKERSNVYEKV